MPMYEYQCAACGHHLEAIQKFSDKPLKTCPKCKKAKLEKLLSKSAIQFKGSGWYITDYARKSSPDTTKSEKDSSAKESKAESPKESSSDAGTSAKEPAKPAAKADSAKSAASGQK
jgi:putative FmdB family regulatory protein